MSRICCIDPLADLKWLKPLGDSLVDTSSGNCTPVFNSSTGGKHFIQLLIQNEINVTFLVV